MKRHLAVPVMLGLVCLLAVACSGAASPTLQDVGNRGGPTSGEPPNGDSDSGNDPNAAPVLPGEQLIVYTGTLELEVADIGAAVTAAEQLIKGIGGHVASSRSADADSGKSAVVTYRIPADRWSDALTGLRALASRIVTEITASEDVTAQVVDLDARLTNLRTTEAALQSIMDRATTITDVLKVQSELTTVRGDIESLTAQRDMLAQRAALATLEVGYNAPVAATSLASESWDLGAEIDSALAALVRLGQGALSLLVWVVIVIVPIFLPIAAVILLAVWLRRRWVATHPPAPIAGPPPWTPSM